MILTKAKQNEFYLYTLNNDTEDHSLLQKTCRPGSYLYTCYNGYKLISIKKRARKRLNRQIWIVRAKIGKDLNIPLGISLRYELSYLETLIFTGLSHCIDCNTVSLWSTVFFTGIPQSISGIFQLVSRLGISIQ